MTLVRVLMAVAAAALGGATVAAAQTTPPVPTPPAQAAPSVQAVTPEGEWRGTSTCTPQAILCQSHDIVIDVYKTPTPGLYDAEFSIVRDGGVIPDNRLNMTFNDKIHVLTGRFTDEHRWANAYILAVRGDTLHGILFVNGRLVERGLDLKRTLAVAPPFPGSDGSASSASSPSV